MTTRLAHVVVDAQEPSLVAEFWAGLLGWEVVPGAGEGGVAGAVTVSAPEPENSPLSLVLVPAPGHKEAKNRIHLDLASATVEQQRSIVDEARARGASSVDIGQSDDLPWVVLADPEGNEFCVLEPRAEYAGIGALAAVVVDVTDPEVLAPFWSAASGWDVVRQQEDFVSLRAPEQAGPWLELLRVPGSKNTVNRWRLDVAVYDTVTGAGIDAPAEGEGDLVLAHEVRRLSEAGAVPVTLAAPATGVRYRLLADPDGNEFGVLALSTGPV
ncbi:VOC family protein [Prauserella cavernicola]|uniref:VOC family protein n=1 Tax=Prauserella cavernicola TaxID=2800127 RepID=A0A934QTS8_9PSEU|nr:VOC family protein [Prauserella cavernicola]MBK1786153.1 VOC family protein [Prauserella cavernicola]